MRAEGIHTRIRPRTKERRAEGFESKAVG